MKPLEPWLDRIVPWLNDVDYVFLTFGVSAVGAIWMFGWTIRELRKAGDTRRYLQEVASGAPVDPSRQNLVPVLCGPDGTPRRTSRAPDAPDVVTLAAIPATLRQGAPFPWTSMFSAMLVGLGIFGTFVGLAFGIQALHGIQAQGSDAMLDNIETLIGGMATAFYSSIAGVGLSIGILLLDGGCRGWTRYRVTHHRTAALRRVHLAHPGLLLAAQEPEVQARAADTLSKAASALADAAGNFSAEALGERIGAAIQDVLREEMKPSFDTMRDALMGIEEKMANQNEDVIQQLFQRLEEEVIRPLSDKLEKSTEQTQRVAAAVEVLHGSLGDITTKLAESTARIQEFQEETLTQMRGFAEELKKVLEEFRDETRGLVTRVTEQVTLTIREAGETATGLIDKARTDLDDTLRRTNETVQKELEAFRVQYQDALTSFFKEQNRLLDQTLGEHRGGLHRVVNRLHEVFSEEAERHAEFVKDHDEAVKTLRSLADDTRQLLDLTGATRAEVHEQLRQVARDLNEGQHTLARHVHDLRDYHDRLLDQGVGAVEQYVGRAQKSYEASFENLDQQLTRILTHVGGTADQLASATDDVLRTLKGFAS